MNEIGDWIPCTERLPELYVPVMVWRRVDNDPYLAVLSTGYWCLFGTDVTFPMEQITHWAELTVEPPSFGANMDVEMEGQQDE